MLDMKKLLNGATLFHLRTSLEMMIVHLFCIEAAFNKFKFAISSVFTFLGWGIRLDKVSRVVSV